MECSKFQDLVTDYLEGAMESRLRAECAAHRLICRECRELYTDVRATVQALNSLATDQPVPSPELPARILAATSAGEMLSCGNFDKLLEQYFDGVILAPTFQTFQNHFAHCQKCRRLMAGIEEAIELCHEIKETEIEVPDSLHDRIVAATMGKEEHGAADRLKNRLSSGGGIILGLLQSLLTPQVAAAMLIFAASGLLILSRFGSVRGMASHAEAQAEIIVNHSQRAINQTGAAARTNLQKFSRGMNTYFFTGQVTNAPASPTPAAKESRPAADRTPEPAGDHERKDNADREPAGQGGRK